MGTKVFATFVLSKLGFVPPARAHLVAFEVYRGRTAAELETIIKSLYDEQMRPWMSPGAIAAVKAHQKLGHRVVIATAAGRPFATPLAEELGFDDVLASELAFDGAVCTGHVDGEVLYGEAKLLHVEAYARARCGARGLSLLQRLRVRPAAPRGGRHARRRRW